MGKSKSLKKCTVGWKKFGPNIDITDPCYDKNVWCRKNGVGIVPGSYKCIAWVDPETDRVMIAGIYLEGIVPTENSMKTIGEVGVDAGLCGFFENKPDYNDQEWDDFCNKIEDRSKNAWINKEGFFTESGFGDGCYGVRAYKDSCGSYTSIEIVFA